MIEVFVRLQVNLHRGMYACADTHNLLCWKSPYFAIFSPQFLHICEVSFIPIYKKGDLL
jgi:hypothetical protein